MSENVEGKSERAQEVKRALPFQKRRSQQTEKLSESYFNSNMRESLIKQFLTSHKKPFYNLKEINKELIKQKEEASIINEDASHLDSIRSGPHMAALHREITSAFP